MCNFEGCRKGLHPLKVIASFEWEDEAKVVRWCPECGAIVVDLDYDGRTNPGYYNKLQYPNITKKIWIELMRSWFYQEKGEDMSVNIKTDNGWYHINDIKPNGEEKVLVILERESCVGCTYDFTVCESIYRNGYPQGYFLDENSAWKVRYWRRKELTPYPNGVVRREIEECKRHNVNPYKIIEHQKMCGIEVVD